jgi:hypothetical protein
MRSSSSARILGQSLRVSFVAFLCACPALAEPAGTRAPVRDATRTQAPAASIVSAVEGTSEGRIVGLEEERLIVDVGRRAGAVVGDVAELWRPLALRHPVTGQLVSDRYRTGSLRITEVLEVVSFAEVSGSLRQPARPGDIVVMHTVRAVAPTKAAPAEPPANPAAKSPKGDDAAKSPKGDEHGAPTDADAESAALLVDSLRGKALPQRIQSLEAWLSGNASSRYARAIGEELYLLRQLAAGQASTATAAPNAEAVSPAPAASADATPPPSTAPDGEESTPVAVRFSSPSHAMGNSSLDIGVEVRGEPRGMVLHSRNAGEVSYVTARMLPEGPHYWVVRLPAERVRAPSLEYFVEAVQADGESSPLIAGADAPLRVAVDDPPRPEPPLRHRSTASVYTDYADYNRLRGDDRVWQTEGMFGMRFADVGVRAVRSGFGVYRGVGGSITELDVQKLEPRRVGLTYGHVESELGFSQTTGLILRLALGLRESGVSGGGQLHLRIGSDLDTNLTIGGEVLGGIGVRGVAQLELGPRARVPVLFRTEVTNQPAGQASDALPGVSSKRGEIGGRVIVQGGYRLFPPLVLFGRLSYQGRTIVHAGPGFGGGVQYEW